ncbi:Ca-activated chloride channel family protein [Archangium gephyra]|uniref:Ca-activated chloride channel family protein n=1 Tax=Archangium gephyra TaxID=48 RepID=A0AAC8Q1I8_9BACT|nr:VWA domain-containing protein [Archangium gephyra]AKI99218.1 Von Willebrand factor type A domain protein [Archangium gephyra]REG31123.1 Ca-activated chloride channel family protein [Archangium gephyra]
MNRTALLLATTGLLALTAAVVGLPRQKDTSHTLAQPGEAPTGVVLPLATAKNGPVTLEGKLSGAYLITGPSEAYAVLTVRADKPREQTRVPVSLALVIDRSGSMRGQKLADAKQAARLLVQQLGAEDRLALVHYGSDVRVFPSQQVTEEVRQQMLAFVDTIEDAGATNISGGLQAAAQQLLPYVEHFRVSRILLLSDGQPTEGLVEDSELLKLADTYQHQGMTVSGLGVGDEFNERLMRGLAEQGGGFYGYIQDSEKLGEIVRRELEQAAGTLARGVELRLELPEGVGEAEVMGVPARREGNSRVVRLYDLAGGQDAQVVVKLTLDLGASPGADRGVLGVRLRYQDVEAARPVETYLPLAAKVTDDEALVRANLDQDVRVHAVRALGAREMQAAAEEMKRGNRQKALGMLDNARALFGSSASALAGELADVDRTKAAYLNAQDETSVKREALQLHRKSLKTFGQNNSYGTD